MGHSLTWFLRLVVLNLADLSGLISHNALPPSCPADIGFFSPVHQISHPCFSLRVSTSAHAEAEKAISLVSLLT